MRKPLIACSLVLVAAIPAPATQAALATAASTLFESTPFILAGAVFAALSPALGHRIMPFMGCGCGGGPSARSIPAAAASWLLLNPVIAVTRFAAAFFVAELRLRMVPHSCVHRDGLDLLGTLWEILPYALCSGSLIHVTSAFFDASAGLSVPLAVLMGAVLAFFASPCALGTVAMAAVLVKVQPAVAAGVLAVAGIADLRTMRPPRASKQWNDPLAYLLWSFACAAAALHHGGSLLNPRFTPALWLCAATCACLAWRWRAGKPRRVARIAPALMLAGLLAGAPVPAYHATETTLANAFSGERIDFTGVVTSTGGHCALVRYAIMCCRADAQPIAIRLSGQMHPTPGNWMRAWGSLVTENGGFALRVHGIAPVAPPTDPFVYR